MATTLTIGAGANNYASDEGLDQAQTNRVGNLSQLTQLLLDENATGTWTIDENDLGQIIASLTDASSQSFHIVVPGSSLGLSTTAITGGFNAVLKAITGGASSFQIISGGTYDSGSQSISGGTTILSAAASPTQWTFSTPATGGGSLTTTVTGNNLPSSFTGTNGIEQVFDGQFTGGSGSNFSIESITVKDNGTTVHQINLGSQSTSDTFNWGTSGGNLETLTLTGTTNNAFTSTLINHVFPSSFTLDSLIPIVGSIPFNSSLPIIATNITGFTLTDNVSNQAIATLSESGTGVAPGTNSTTYLASLGGGTVDASVTTANIEIGFGSGNGFLRLGATFAPVASGNVTADPLTGGANLKLYPGSTDPGTVTGGSGYDVAIFNSAKSNYTIAFVTGGVTVTPNATVKNGTSVITLKNFEELDFSDGSTLRLHRAGEKFENFTGTLPSQILAYNASTGHAIALSLNGASVSSTDLGTKGAGWSVVGVGDFNGDDVTDILWRNSSTGGNAIVNSGSASTVSLATLASTWSVAGTGDFNHDGTTDILWRNSATNDYVIYSLKNDSVTATTDIGLVGAPWSVVGTGDFNGDGTTDILWRNATTGDTVIFTINGSSVASTTDLGIIGPAWTMAGIGDFNRDGTSDILWRNNTTGDDVVFTLSSNTIASSANIGAMDTSWSVVNVGDFNGDLASDILWRQGAAGAFEVWQMDGASVFSDTSLAAGTGAGLTIVGGGLPAPPTRKPFADFDGNGTSDIAWRNGTNGDAVIFLVNGATVTSSVDLGAVGSAWSIAAIGDFNGDGTADLLWRNSATGGDIVYTINHGSIAATTDIGAVSSTWAIAAVGDFNGDGTADLLWRNTATGGDVVFSVNSGTVTSSTDIGAVSTAWKVVGSGDFNGDGTTDLLWRKTATGDTVIFDMNHATVASYADLGKVDTAWTIAGVGDFNGDGTSDILWRNTVTGDNVVYLMNNNTISSTVSIGAVSTAWSVAEVGDFNGNGTDDILWRKAATGDDVVYLMSAGTVASTVNLGAVASTWSIQQPVLAPV